MCLPFPLNPDTSFFVKPEVINEEPLILLQTKMIPKTWGYGNGWECASVRGCGRVKGERCMVSC